MEKREAFGAERRIGFLKYLRPANTKCSLEHQTEFVVTSFEKMRNLQI